MTKRVSLLASAALLLGAACGGTESDTTNEERAAQLISALASSAQVKLEDTTIYVESSLTIGSGKKLTIGDGAKLYLSEGSDLTVNVGSALVVEKGGHLEVGSGVIADDGSVIEVGRDGYLGVEEELTSNGGRIVNEGRINTSNNLVLNAGASLENRGVVEVTVDMLLNSPDALFHNLGNLQVMNTLHVNGGLLKNGVDDGSVQNPYDGNDRNLVLENVQMNGAGSQLVNLPGWYGWMHALTMTAGASVTNMNEEPGSLTADTCDAGEGTIVGEVYWCEGHYPADGQ